MLYDPKWEQKTKQDFRTLPALISWLEQRPPESAYDYVCNGHCLVAQYYTAHGFRDVDVNSCSLRSSSGFERLPRHFNDIAVGRAPAGSNASHALTFGAALERARAFLS